MSHQRNVFITLLAVLFFVSIFSVVAIGNQVYGAKWKYRATLAGQNEVPPVNTHANGLAQFRALDNDTGLRYRINVTGISAATGADIYSGKTGENGKIIFNLLQKGFSKDKQTSYGMIIRGNVTNAGLLGQMKGKTIADLVSAMEGGNVYVGIQTQHHPKGEIRGQINIINDTDTVTNLTNANPSGVSTQTQ